MPSKPDKSDAKPRTPVVYSPAAVAILVEALADGLTQEQACIACGIGRTTLWSWKQQYPDFREKLEASREKARRDALAALKSAGAGAKGDWRATEAFLRYSFQSDYHPRADTQVNVGVGVRVDQIVTEEQRQRLIVLREKITGSKLVYPQASAEAVLPPHVAATQIQVQSSNDATSGARPGSPWSLPAGANTPSDASPAFKAWLEVRESGARR